MLIFKKMIGMIFMAIVFFVVPATLLREMGIDENTAIVLSIIIGAPSIFIFQKRLAKKRKGKQ